MKLLVVFDHRFERRPDGAVTSPKHYGWAFFARRHLRVFDDVTIVARVAERATAPADAEPTEGPGVRVVSLGDWHGPFGLLRAWRPIRRTLDRELDAAAAVVVIAPGMLASLARTKLVRDGRPYGVEVVGDPWDALAPGSMRHPLRPYLRWSAARELRRVCADAAAAAYVTRAALQRRYPCPARSVGVSDVVLPATTFVPGARTFAPGAPRTLVTVGTMAQLYKAQDVLIDAVGRCVGDGVDVRLVLVGDGRHRAALEERASRLGLAERVRFTGALPAGEAVRHELDAADCFVLPSRQEGLPRAMVEAMARALPCVGSTVGGIPELLPDEDLVAPGDATALATKLVEVLGDDTRLARMSARNLATAAEYREELLEEARLGFLRHVREATRGALGAAGEACEPPAARASRRTRAAAAAPRRAPSLRANAGWALAGNLGYAACQCAILIVLAKLSSAEDVGRFALALALTAPVMIAASLQLRVVQATDARGEHGFGAYLGLRLVATALAVVAILTLAWTAGYPHATIALVALVALAKAFEAVSDVVFGLLQQHEDLRRVALSMLAKGALSVAATALVLRATGDLLLATLAMAAAWGATLVCFDLPAARRLADVRPSLDPRTLGRLAWTALPMGVVAGLQSLMTNVPRYAIEAHGGALALGYFAGIAYLITAGNQPMMALWAAVGPRSAQLFVADRDAYRRLVRRTVLLATGMGAVTIAGAATIGGPVLARLYTPDYAAHADVLVWLAVTAAVGYQASALSSHVTAARRFPEQLWVALVMLAVSWAASTLLVPRFGLTGAAWALLAATLVQTACLAAVYRSCAGAARGDARAVRRDAPTVLGDAPAARTDAVPASAVVATDVRVAATTSSAFTTRVGRAPASAHAPDAAPLLALRATPTEATS